MGILQGVTLSFTLKKVSHLPVIPLVWATDEEDDRLNICSLHMQGQIPPSHHITSYTRERNPADGIFDLRSMLWLQLLKTLLLILHVGKKSIGGSCIEQDLVWTMTETDY